MIYVLKIIKTFLGINKETEIDKSPTCNDKNQSSKNTVIQSPYKLFKSGLNLLNDGQHYSAEEYFKKALKLYQQRCDYSGASMVNNYLAIIYKKTNQLNKMLNSYEDALPTPAGFRELRNFLRILGKCSLREGNIKEATNYLDKLISLSHLFRICYGFKDIDKGGFVRKDFDEAQTKLTEFIKKHGTLYPFTYEKNGVVTDDNFLSNYDYEMIINKISRERQIISIIKNNPGILQKEIHKYINDLSKDHIRSIAYDLNKEKIIIRKKCGNTYKLFVNSKSISQ